MNGHFAMSFVCCQWFMKGGNVVDITSREVWYLSVISKPESHGQFISNFSIYGLNWPNQVNLTMMMVDPGIRDARGVDDQSLWLN